MFRSSSVGAFRPRGTTQQRRRRVTEQTLLRGAILLAVVLLVIGGLAIGSLWVAIVSQARHDETAPADAIVVLGAAQWNGLPSPIFKARLDHALRLYREHEAPLIVLTGGVGDGSRYAEANVGREYLIEQGVPESALVSVPQGNTTLESLIPTRAALAARGATKVLLVSDPFHMFRSKRMAEDLGLTALASPTRTSPIRPGSPTEYAYMAREVAAYLAYVFLRK
ncbi:MAG TPA: YdcF family protein [Thermomicrobiaceae bacterium]|nr:YdcF family protein [Thermomicrobiaceae bacterium]